MSRRSLGPNWKKGTPEQRKEFVSVFSELLAKTYLKRIRNNALTSEVKILSSDVDENKALVRTVAISDGDDITVDYRMRMRNNKWTIYDIIIANVGLVSNYRSEFSGIVSNEGFAGLISRLREKHLSNDDEQS
jgi:phospholipid transport system substrate-binding protein